MDIKEDEAGEKKKEKRRKNKEVNEDAGETASSEAVKMNGSAEPLDLAAIKEQIDKYKRVNK